MKPRVITVLNGSLGGAGGNTGAVSTVLVQKLASRFQLQMIELSQPWTLEDLKPKLEVSDGFIFTTGTYWDSWGSPLQRFLEEATELEAGNAWLGKPAACLVTMHSVGGKEVLSRLQGVLSTLGLLIPPMSGMVYSLVGHIALKCSGVDQNADIWQLQDLNVIAANLAQAIEGGRQWTQWPVDGGDARRKWFF